MDILKYVPDCEVVAPGELREKARGVAFGGGEEAWE